MNAASLGSKERSVPLLWELPEVVLFHIVGFVAGPTRRAAVICHTLAPLCKSAKQSLLDNEERAGPVWDAVLKEDYRGKSVEGPLSGYVGNRRAPARRSCKRLKKSVIQQVQAAHQLIKDHTEIAFFYIAELCTGPSAHLTKAGMVRILEEYGPYLRINEVVSSGGVFLVEICRARAAKEATVLKCVEVIMEEYGAHADPRTNEANNSRQTALCVAAARGMSKVVSYLLGKSASVGLKSSGRFRLHTQRVGRNRSIRCDNVTALEFATAMKDAETEAGANPSDLRGLDQCINLLTKAEKSKSDRKPPPESRLKAKRSGGSPS